MIAGHACPKATSEKIIRVRMGQSEARRNPDYFFTGVDHVCKSGSCRQHFTIRVLETK
jgi:hypothetical protein